MTTTSEIATATDLVHLRSAIRLSADAVAQGSFPFGALLVDAEGGVVLAAENTATSSRDLLSHAEINLVRLVSQRYSPSLLSESVLYASCEPCAMCAGAIYWAGIGRVVYGLSGTSLLRLGAAHPDRPTLDVPCRTVFAGGLRATRVVGPAIEDEAAIPHRGFWP